MPGYARYKPVESEYELKKLELPGVYVVKVTDEKTLQATTLVIGSDLDAIVKTLARSDPGLCPGHENGPGPGRRARAGRRRRPGRARGRDRARTASCSATGSPPAPATAA